MPGILHNDIFHLLWNCFVLIVVGCNAEYYLGSIGYAILLGCSILLGNSFTAAFRYSICYMSVGASTAIEGILAFEVIWFLFNFRNMGLSVFLYMIYYGTILLTTLLGIFTPGYVVEFWGHLGGFVAGACVTALFFQAIAQNSVLKYARYIFALVLGGLLFFSIIVIFSRSTKYCTETWCYREFRIK
jgi:rhomboid protease GluP